MGHRGLDHVAAAAEHQTQESGVGVVVTDPQNVDPDEVLAKPGKVIGIDHRESITLRSRRRERRHDVGTDTRRQRKNALGETPRAVRPHDGIDVFAITAAVEMATRKGTSVAT